MRLLGIVTRHVSAKLILPYVVVITLLAAGGTFIVVRLVASSLDERLVSQLVDAGRKANDGMVTLENEHLRTVRALAFSEGMDRAIEDKDPSHLFRIVRPVQVNARAFYVDALDSQGSSILSTRLSDLEVEQVQPPGDIVGWPIVQRVLARHSDDLGDKFSAMVPTARGYLLSTAGPVLSDEGLVGIIVVSAPEREVVNRLYRESLAAVTLYDPQGRIVATALPYSSVDAGAGLAEQRFKELRELAGARDTVLRRKLRVGEREYEEAIGMLQVRRSPALAMGVSVPSDYIQEAQVASRDQLIMIFVIAVLWVLAIGLALARHITLPIVRLVAANREVMGGNLNRYIRPSTADEVGLLTHSFNDMVAGLRERERVKDTFGKYMSEEVSRHLLRSELKLGGERREITVLMSDIRSFTTISETMDPEALVSFLNRYFSRMVPCLLANGGRVDKYMGDAILASFGAPISYPDHAEKAVRSALMMRERLARFNQERQNRGQVTIRIGIGINTGVAVVGNIGSSDRLEYTIIGDVVNTTQRTEDLTKEFACDILITDSTYQQCKHVVAVGEPQMVTLRGRTQATPVYPLLGLSEVGQEKLDAQVSPELSLVTDWPS